MIQNAIGTLAVLLIIASCGSNQHRENLSGPGPGAEAIMASIPEILADPLEYEGKTISIEGVITHVCRHGGDKMRVLQEGSELSIQVMLGNFTGQFDVASEGRPVKLTGLIVTEVTNLDELAHHTHDGEAHECETTREAIEIMEARGLDPRIRTYLALDHYE